MHLVLLSSCATVGFMHVPNLRELSRLADVDERTLIRFFSSEAVRPRLKARIERAWAEMRRQTKPEEKKR